jgi:hypothetical protein
MARLGLRRGHAADSARPTDHAGPSIPRLTLRVALAATVVVGLAYVVNPVAPPGRVGGSSTPIVWIRAACPSSCGE